MSWSASSATPPERRLSGQPGEQKLHSRLRSTEDAQRMWKISEDLVGFQFPDA